MLRRQRPKMGTDEAAALRLLGKAIINPQVERVQPGATIRLIAADLRLDKSVGRTN